MFTALSTGGLQASTFRIGTCASHASDRILYDDTTGKLSHDPDGVGGKGHLALAVLDPGLKLSAGDLETA